MAGSVTYIYFLKDMFTRNAIAMAAAAKRVAGSTRAAAAGVALMGAALTAGGLMALTGMVGAYADWEERLASVHKVMPAAAGDFKHVKNAIRELSSELPYAREQIAAFFDEGIRASVADPSKGPVEYARQLKIFAKLAGETSFAFDMPADRAAEMLAKIKSSLNLSLPAMKQYMQQINLLGDTMATKEKDILEVVRRVSALGQSGAEQKNIVAQREAVAALGAAMTAAGARSEVAATGIRNFLLRAGKGKYATKDTRKALKWLGLDATKFAKLMSNDVLSAAEMALEKIKEIGSAEKRNAAIAGIFGLKAVDAFAPLLANVGLIRLARDLTADMARRETRWGNALRIKFSTMNAHITMMKNSMKFFRDGLVVEWTDEIVWATDTIRDMADALNEMPMVKKIMGGALAATIAVGSLIMILGLLALSLSALGATAVGVGAVLSVLVMGSLALSALAAGAYLVISNWENVKSWFSGFGAETANMLSGTGEILQGIFEFDSEKIGSGLSHSLEAGISLAAMAARGAWESVRSVFSLVGIDIGGFDTLKNDVVATLEYLKGLLSETFTLNIDWPEMPGWLKKLGGLVSNAVSSVIPAGGPQFGPASGFSSPSTMVAQAASERLQIENSIRSDVNVTSQVTVTTPGSIALTLPGGGLAGHIPLGSNASRGQNMATSTTKQTVNK